MVYAAQYIMNSTRRAKRNQVVLTPMSSLAKNTPMITVASSGAEEPAAIKVAPATSGDNLNSKNNK